MGLPTPSEPPPTEGPLVGAGSRALRNTALVVGARVVAQLLTLLTFMVMNRHLSPDELGAFGFVVGTSSLVTVILDLGFNTLFQREASRRRGELDRYLSNLVSARVLFAVPALAVFGIVLWGAGQQRFLAAGFTLMVLASYASLLRNALYAIQSLGYEVVAILLESLVLLSAIGYGALAHQGPGYYLWANALRWGFACAFFVVVLNARGIARTRWRLEPRLVREWLWRGLPFALTFIITGIYFKIDVLLLTYLRGLAEMGLYTSGYKLFEAILFLPQTMLSVAFPVLALMHRDESRAQLGWAVARLAKGMVLAGWPITVGCFLLTPGLRFVYYYAGSGPVLRILSLGIVFMFVNNAFIGALNAVDRQSSFTWAALWSMVANVGLNLVLIPLFGYLGAASATVATEVALTVFAWVLTARHVVRLPVLRLSWKGLLAGLVMGAALLPFRDVTGAFLAAVIVWGGLVYAGTLLVLRPFDESEWRIVRQALRARR